MCSLFGISEVLDKNEYDMLRGIIIILFAALFVGCAKQKTEEAKSKEKTLEKYVYIDTVPCVHISKKCVEIMFSPIRRVQVTRLTDEDVSGLYCCSYCIDDTMYERLKREAKRNDYVKKVHEELTLYYNDVPSYDEFILSLDSSEIRNIYEQLQEAGSELPDYNYFLNALLPIKDTAKGTLLPK